MKTIQEHIEEIEKEFVYCYKTQGYDWYHRGVVVKELAMARKEIEYLKAKLEKVDLTPYWKGE